MLHTTPSGLLIIDKPQGVTSFDAVAAVRGRALGKAAGALDELQPVIALPGDDVVLVDAVHGADELHAREIAAAQLRRHGLQL